MELTLLGTGEAFDSDRYNTSYLLKTSSESIMIDCGYDSSKSLRRVLKSRGRSFLDTPDNILFTHFHGDHFAGLSALLIPLWDDVRNSRQQRRLTILSPDKSLQERVEKRMSEDYPGLYEEFGKEGLCIDFRNIDPKEDYIGKLNVRGVLTNHSIENYAYRFEEDDLSFSISGDGALSNESRELYRGTDLLIHEGFFVDKASKTHASIQEVVDFAIAEKIPKVGIVHINQIERKEGQLKIQGIVKRAEEKEVEVFFPYDHQQISF